MSFSTAGANASLRLPEFFSSACAQFLDKLYDMMDFLLPNYINEGKNQLVVAVGCTGGKHRSVTVARALCAHLTARAEYGIKIEHRDIDKDNKRK